MSRPIEDVLEEARDLGFLGPGPIDRHVQHARDMAASLEADGFEPDHRRCLDLGSGGGVPGFTMAQTWDSTSWVFLEANGRRAAFLRRAIAECELTVRVAVVEARSEVASHEPLLRTTFDLVTARSFGPPAVTAECAAPFLQVGARMIVSEPPPSAGGDEPSSSADRWNDEGLGKLGMGAARAVGDNFHYVICEQHSVCPERFARRVSIPTKRPLW